MLELSGFQRPFGNRNSEELLQDLQSETKDGLATKALNERLVTIKRRRELRPGNRD